MEAEVADHTWRQLRALAAAPPRGAAPAALRIFKGGGYILADLEAMLKVTGLEGVLRVQREIRGAQCILAMERCSNGKRVNLRQVSHEVAYTHTHIHTHARRYTVARKTAREAELYMLTASSLRVCVYVRVLCAMVLSAHSTKRRLPDGVSR